MKFNHRAKHKQYRAVGAGPDDSCNTQHFSEDEARTYMAEVEAKMGLPTVDPFRDSADRLADALIAL